MSAGAIADFIARWSASAAAERANKDLFLTELCDALGVPRPDPATGDVYRDTYVFEKSAFLLKEGPRSSTGFVDLYKAGCFILEAKQGSNDASTRTGTARRGTGGWSNAMQEAFGQALQYARTLDDPPPFLIVCDIGHCFDLYAAFDGSLDYRPFPDPRRSRIFLSKLADHADTLRAIFLDPRSLDPAKHAAKVTRDIAGHLAELAKGLEAEGHEPERIARFLMRCLFTMFAEDAGLLPERIFTNELEKTWIKDPSKFAAGCESLWRAMEAGNDFGYLGKLLRFNGGLFQDPTALPLTRPDLERLLEAAKASWVAVEPAIFGTLLERALDPRERHRLGAHYTPRAYVERLVKPTIEEPVRAEWDTVRTQVHQLVAQGKEQDAREAVKGFLRHLCSIRVLDPACGTGNFLYVTLDFFKRLEGEVVKLLFDLGEKQESLAMAGGFTVTPAQFLGIEVKPWAREIANLVLWIGCLQWQLRSRGDASHFPEPVLREYGNIECRDAVLAWDRIEPVLDESGNPVTRWDGVTTKTSPVTGEQIPDDTARVPVVRYVNPSRAEWPRADYVVGNPPYVGNKRMRLALGDGYVEALRAAHDDVPETADLVMYWWNQAARLTSAGEILRFGLITTNSITQTFNRRIVQAWLGAKKPVSIVFAIPDHPWVDSVDGADVRVAMTVAISGGREGELLEVTTERAGDDDAAQIMFNRRIGRVHADLSIGAAVHAAVKLQANEGMSYQGPILVGEGFRLTPDELTALGIDKVALPSVVRPYVIGRDIVQRREERYVIDFFGLSEREAREAYPALHHHVLVRVKPERDENRMESRRRDWWIFGANAPKMRYALRGLRRFIVTVETSKHKPFVFLPEGVCPDHKLYAVASDDAYLLGVLSAKVHRVWALAAGGRLGVGNDPTWTNTTCFLPYPFPDSDAAHRARIRDLGERLDSHRAQRQQTVPTLTLTAIYNVLEKARSGASLTPAERRAYDDALGATLQQLHDELDAAVFDAYGWPHDLTDEQILERLVALNAERAEEERRGLIRWLRPEFQNPQGEKAAQGALVDVGGGKAAKSKKLAAQPAAWPKELPSRIAAVRTVLESRRGAASTEELAKAFRNAKRAEVASILESLSMLGLAVAKREGERIVWSAVKIA
jgi:hypothetical protein